MNLNFGKNIDRVIQELPEYAAELMKENEKEIIALEKEQLLSGLRADGKKTLEYKSEAYIKRANKKSAKSFPNRNYKLTGGLHSELFLEYPGGSKTYFGSYNEFAPKFEKEEGDNLFGITPENNPVVSKIIVKPLLNKVGNELSK